ncbi:MAG: ZIP family metal transporter [Candidatus Pacearchaeota archaeon]
MIDIWLYSIASVIIVSALAFFGAITLSLKEKTLKRILIYFIAFSAGALLGDVFIHLLPEVVEENGFTLMISIYLILGIGFSFVIEKFIHWRHCHHPTTKQHPHPLSTMNLVGEGVHNFIDGIIIGTSYLISIPVGIATTLAVIFHEIPQEISDFGVLVYGGFTKSKALIMNFLIALTSVLGAVIALLLGTQSEKFLIFLVPFAAGNFIYIAAADLIPELHKNSMLKESLMQLFLFVFGVLVMTSLLILEV